MTIDCKYCRIVFPELNFRLCFCIQKFVAACIMKVLFIYCIGWITFSFFCVCYYAAFYNIFIKINYVCQR